VILRSSSRVSGWPQCPLYPQKRTLPQRKQMSALCQSGHSSPVSVRSARARSEVVRIPSLQASPLDDGTSIVTVLVRAFRPFWPADR